MAGKGFLNETEQGREEAEEGYMQTLMDLHPKKEEHVPLTPPPPPPSFKNGGHDPECPPPKSTYVNNSRSKEN